MAAVSHKVQSLGGYCRLGLCGLMRLSEGKWFGVGVPAPACEGSVMVVVGSMAGKRKKKPCIGEFVAEDVL